MTKWYIDCNVLRFDLISGLLNVALIPKCLHKKSRKEYFQKCTLRFQYYNAYLSNIKISYSRAHAT